MCVYVLEMCLYLSVYVSACEWEIIKRICRYTVSLCVRVYVHIWKQDSVRCVYNVCTCVYVCVFAAGSGDICCVVGWEQSTAGSRSLRPRRWKPRSQPGPVGQDTLAHTTHRYKVTHANIKTYTLTRKRHRLYAHTRTAMSLAHTHSAWGGGHTRTQGRKTNKINRARIKQQSRQNNTKRD